MIKYLFIIFILLFNFSVFAQDCNSLRKKDESYGASDNATSWCDFETQTAYVKCMCDKENNYQNQLSEIKNIGEKYNTDMTKLRSQEENASSSGNYKLAIEYLDERINLVIQNPINQPQYLLDRELTTLKGQRKQYENNLKDNINSQNNIEANTSSSTNNSSNNNYSTSNRITQEQATENAINSFGNIIGSIAQNANESAEKNARIEAQKQAERKAIIDERRRELKDGKGSYDGQNRKTGEWTFYYPESTAPMSNGLFKDGKKDLLWLIYEDEGYTSDFSKKIKEAVFYENGSVKAKFKARNIQEIFTDLDESKYLTLKATELEMPNGKTFYVGSYIENNRKGVRVKEGLFNRNGEKEGKWIYGYDRTEKTYFQLKKFNLKAEENFKNGNFEGIQKNYYQNGNVSNIFNYSNGIREGLEKKFHKDGTLIGEYNYINGKLEGKQKEFFNNGNLKRILEYKNGILYGESKTYHENEELESVGVYNNGLLVGLEKKYSSEGFEITNSNKTESKMNKLDYFSEVLDYLKKIPTGLVNQTDINFHMILWPNGIDMIDCVDNVRQPDGSYIKCDKVQTSDNNYSDNKYLYFTVNNKWGILTSRGKTLIPAEWNHIGRNYNDNQDIFFIVEKNYQFNVINKKGKFVFSSFYDLIDFWGYYYPENPYFLVANNFKFGLVNEKDEVILPLKYDFIGQKQAVGKDLDLARVKIDNKWGYINGNLKLAIPLIYDSALPFSKGKFVAGKGITGSYAEVTLNGESFVIDINGNRKE